MLKIDLLPDKQRKVIPASVEQLHRVPLLWVLVGFLVSLAFFPMLWGWVRSGQLARLNAKIQVLQPKRAAVDQVQRLLQRLREQEDTFSGLAQEGSSWSKRLNTLSDLTPEDVWFNELMLKQNESLVIRASAIIEGGTEMMQVGRLVQDLKADAGFSSVVRDIQIESIRRVQEKEIEIIRFTLACSIAERAKP